MIGPLRARSFRWRLAIFSALISGIILSAFGFAAWIFTYRNLLESVDSRLRVPAERMVRRIHPERDWDRFGEGMRFFRREFQQDTIVLVMDNSSGELYFRSDTEEGSDSIRDITRLRDYLPSAAEIAAAPPPPDPNERSGRDRGRGDRDRDRERSDRDRDRERGGGEREGPPPGEGPPGGETAVATTNTDVTTEEEAARPPQAPRQRGPGDFRSSGWQPLGELEFFTATGIDGTRWRTVAVSNATVTAFIGLDLAEFEGDVSEAKKYFLIAAPLGLLAIVVGAWIISRRAIRPLDRIITTASGMTGTDFDKRIPLTGGESQEFSKLVEVLNAMMGRLEGSFHQANRFTADASHELKTPIAIMRAEIESALKSCPPDSPAETSLMNLQEENTRLNRITQSLLLLSQADSGKLKLTEEKVDLSGELEALCEDAEHLCANAGLKFSSELESGVSVQADRILLMQAVQNLLSNAIKYNRDGGSVSCRLRNENGEALVEFSNSGEPIPAEEQEKIFDRFYRVDKARGPGVEGFGLGLNLSREIVIAHGGKLSLLGSDGESTRFELRLASS